jgi:hypothetical protein
MNTTCPSLERAGRQSVQIVLRHVSGRLVVSGRAVLRDLNGRAVQEWQLDGQRQLWLRWDQHLPAGIYLLELLADQAVSQVLKLAIEHH